MIKVNIISGFLGAGKTTFIKRLIQQVFQGEKLVLIENEFGEIGIDGGFLKDAGIEVTEMNSGCICCTLVGDFGKALSKVIETYEPTRILIEPSGVGKLSDVMKAVEDLECPDIVLEGAVSVVDGKKVRLYLENFGEFYENQVEHANTLVMSRTQFMSGEEIERAVKALKSINSFARLITTPWEELGKEALLGALEGDGLEEGLMREVQEHHKEEGCCHHGDTHHHHEGGCCHQEGGHHHHEGGCCHQEGGHHHHEGGCCHQEGGHHHHEEGCCHQEGGHHHHEEGCCHQEGGHRHHEEGCCHHGEEHHHADEVFTSWGRESAHLYTKEELDQMVKQLSQTKEYGVVLRAKGILKMEDGSWKQFDLVPEEYEIREGQPDYTGRFCVIGTNLKEAELEHLFHV